MPRSVSANGLPKMSDELSNDLSPAARRLLAARNPDRDAFRRGLVVPIVAVLIWQAAAMSGLFHSPLLISPTKVLMVPFLDKDGRSLWNGLSKTMVRMALGFALGGGFGLFIGILTGFWPTARRIIGPTVNSLRQITLLAWIPLLTGWLGNGDPAILALVAMGTFFPVALNTERGLRSTPQPLLEVARVFTLGRWKTIWTVLIPASLPSISVGLQLGLMHAWVGTIGAEYMVGFGQGLGSFMAQGRESMRMDIVILSMVVIAAIGFAINFALTRLFARLRHAGT